ncbi:MAG: hypothetical protein IH948_08185 [Bacteroidetes bacterium]|nr:hypothetical protein [Bacteroidota bacterium]
MRTGIAIIMFSGFILSGCDCMQYVQGRTVDEKTGQSITGVVIRLENDTTDLFDPNKSIGISKHNGVFTISEMSSGVFGCPDIELYLFKKGYLPAKIIVPHFTSQKIVKMVPVK